VASYGQARAQLDAGDFKRVTWVCGSERVLVEELVDLYRALVGASEMERSILVAGSDTDREVWAAVNQYPFQTGANRLVVVRDADRIKRWKPLKEWLSTTRQMPTNHILFVSSEPTLQYKPVEGGGVDSRGKPKVELVAHLRWIADASNGALYECRKPAATVPVDSKTRRPVRSGPPDIVLWVQRHVRADDKADAYLLQRVGGDLSRARAVCSKAQLFRGDLTEPVVDELAAEFLSDEDFADALLNLNKPRALLSLDQMSERDYSRTIGFLDSQLESLHRLNRALRQGARSNLELVSASGLDSFVVMRLRGVAKVYDYARVKHARRVLTVADDALRSGSIEGAGARDGVMESLIALW